MCRKNAPSDLFRCFEGQLYIHGYALVYPRDLDRNLKDTLDEISQASREPTCDVVWSRPIGRLLSGARVYGKPRGVLDLGQRRVVFSCVRGRVRKYF